MRTWSNRRPCLNSRTPHWKKRSGSSPMFWRAMTDVLIACDLQGRIQEVNQALLELAGETETVLIGRKLSGFAA